MVGDSLQWVAIAVEFLGLALIAIELYSPRLSARLRHLLDASNDRDDLDKAIRIRSMMTVVGLYIATWITIVGVLSLQFAASFFALFAARALDKDPPHGLGCGRKEMVTVLPSLRIARIDKS